MRSPRFLSPTRQDGGSWENMRNILGLGSLRALDEFRKGDFSKCLTC